MTRRRISCLLSLGLKVTACSAPWWHPQSTLLTPLAMGSKHNTSHGPAPLSAQFALWYLCSGSCSLLDDPFLPFSSDANSCLASLNFKIKYLAPKRYEEYSAKLKKQSIPTQSNLRTSWSPRLFLRNFPRWPPFWTQRFMISLKICIHSCT